MSGMRGGEMKHLGVRKRVNIARLAILTGDDTSACLCLCGRLGLGVRRERAGCMLVKTTARVYQGKNVESSQHT